MPTYKTPGVYTEEISKFPPSVAEVATAVPAFIGYTEKAERFGQNLTNVPTRVKSLLEYQEIFGGGFVVPTLDIVLDPLDSLLELDDSLADVATDFRLLAAENKHGKTLHE